MKATGVADTLIPTLLCPCRSCPTRQGMLGAKTAPSTAINAEAWLSGAPWVASPLVHHAHHAVFGVLGAEFGLLAAINAE